jgi:hypothetical protein
LKAQLTIMRKDQNGRVRQAARRFDVKPGAGAGYVKHPAVHNGRAIEQDDFRAIGYYATFALPMFTSHRALRDSCALLAFAQTGQSEMAADHCAARSLTFLGAIPRISK